MLQEKNYPMGQQQQVGQKYWREKCWNTGIQKKSYMPEWKELLSEQMNYTYPYLQEEQMKLKFTVSELKKENLRRRTDA